jgi:hypothetical protein
MKYLKSSPAILIYIALSLQLIYSCKKEKAIVETPEEPRFFSPSALKAIAFSDSTIRVSWNDNSNIEVSYEIQRKVGTEAFELLKEASANDTVFIDADVAPNLLYTYRVRAKSKNAETSFSDKVTVKLDLPTPVLQSSLVNDSKIKLSWTDNSALESGFVLERSVSGQSFVTIAEPGKNVQSYTDTLVVVNQNYTYRIKAKNRITETEYSNIVAAKILFNAPVLNCSLPGGNTVNLAWNDNSQFEKGYIVEQAVNDGVFKEIAKLDSPLLGYKIENLDLSKKYAFRVKAYSTKSNSPYSNQKNIYYNPSRYIITETYRAEKAVGGEVALSPSTNLIASAGYYSRNVVIANRSTRATSTLATGHAEGTYSVKFSNDNQYLLVTSAQDGNIEIWNVNTRSLNKKIATGMEAAFCLAFNDAGNLLAVGGTGGSKLLIYNFPAMTLKYTLRTDNHNVRDMLFYDNDTKLISCGNNDKIQFWNLATLQVEKTLAGSPGHIGTIDLNSNSSLLTSSSYDATYNHLKIWNTTGSLIRAFTMENGVSRTFFGADNNIYCTDYNGNVQVIGQSGNTLYKTSVGSRIYYADFNKTAKLFVTYSADGNINVLENVPVWLEY